MQKLLISYVEVKIKIAKNPEIAAIATKFKSLSKQIKSMRDKWKLKGSKITIKNNLTVKEQITKETKF